MALDVRQTLKNVVKKYVPPNLVRFYAPNPWGAVALTFDDGPDGIATPAILDALKRNKATATFFVLGKNAEEHPELVRRIVAEGHEVGNHGYGHPDIASSGLAAAMVDLERGERVLQRIIGDTKFAYRPPDGYVSWSFATSVRRRTGSAPVLWSKCVHGEREKSVHEMNTELRALDLTEGDILLLHDVHASTATALPRLIDHLNDLGLGASSLRALQATGR